MTTREEVIAAANALNAYKPAFNWYAFDEEELERFYTIAYEAGRQAEREECAKVCEDLGENIHGPGREDSEAYDCADAIRARGTGK